MLSNGRPLLFTLFFVVTLLSAFAPAVNANPGTLAHRRQANRMLKVRALDNPLSGIIGVGAAPTGTTGSATGSATSSVSSSTASEATSTGSTTASESTSGTSKAVSSSASASTETSSSSSSSTSLSTSSTTSSSTTSSTSSATSTLSTSTSTSSSSSSTASSSSSSSTTSSDVSQITAAPDDTTPPSPNQSTHTITSTLSSGADSASSTESAVAQHAASTSTVSKTTITVIIVVAASVGGIAIIWTIIRKWKFRPSAEFEDRMQPIDWAPAGGHADSDFSGLHRTGSNASHGSFRSGSEHDSLGGGRPYGNGSTGLVADLPSHDFTAGPAHLGGGYADLTRGPSPAPQMAQTVARGPSINRNYGF